VARAAVRAGARERGRRLVRGRRHRWRLAPCYRRGRRRSCADHVAACSRPAGQARDGNVGSAARRGRPAGRPRPERPRSPGGTGDGRAPLPSFVRLSSEGVRQAVRQDCSFAKKQASPPALLVVVHSGRLTLDLRDARNQARAAAESDGRAAARVTGEPAVRSRAEAQVHSPRRATARHRRRSPARPRPIQTQRRAVVLSQLRSNPRTVRRELIRQHINPRPLVARITR